MKPTATARAIPAKARDVYNFRRAIPRMVSLAGRRLAIGDD